MVLQRHQRSALWWVELVNLVFSSSLLRSVDLVCEHTNADKARLGVQLPITTEITDGVLQILSIEQ